MVCSSGFEAEWRSGEWRERMPAMEGGSGGTGGGGTEVEVLFAKLSSFAHFANGMTSETLTSLRLALNSAGSAPPLISQEEPEVKAEVDPDASDDEEPGPSTSAGPARAFGPNPNVGATKNLGFTEALGPDDVPPPPPHPTDPEEVRALMRAHMHRCTVCKNRFVERNLLERHLEERHPEAHAEYVREQQKEMEYQRLAELEQVRREEIVSGGFIPPPDEIDAYISLRTREEEAQGLVVQGPKVSYDRHGRLKLPPRRFTYRKKVSPQCPFCDKRFRNEFSFKKHLAKKHPAYMNFVQCNRCYKCLPGAEDLGPGGHDCDLAHVCFQCEPMRNMCSAQRLLSHRAKFHRGGNSGFRCNECGRKCLTPRKLRKHKKMSHVITKPYKCHFCDEYFPTDTAASLHERVHTGKIRYECDVCDYRANRWQKLERHQREEHGYLCSICHTKLAAWSELKYHTLQEHSGYLTDHSQAVCIESPRVWLLFKGE